MDKIVRSHDWTARFMVEGRRLAVIGLIAILASCQDSKLPSAPPLPIFSQTSESARPSIRHLPDRYIVRLNTPVSELTHRVGDLATVSTGTTGRAWRIINGFEIGGMSEEGLQRLRAHPAVRSLVPDGYDVTATAQTVSGDPGLWGLDRIDQRIGPPFDGVFNYFFTGTGVKIYIVDSGIYPHADFSGRLGTGYSAIADSNPYADPWGHGTMMAGVAAGAVTGVAKGATLVSVRVVELGTENGQAIGLASHADQIEGLQWIQNNSTAPSVVNYSISPKPGSSFNAGVRDALNALDGNGYSVVAAAGNWDQDACLQGRNLFDPDILVASAVNSSNQRAVFPNGEAGNYVSCVDLFAPGHSLTSTFSPGSYYPCCSTGGTSIATAFVTGVVATLLQQKPTASEWEPQYVLKGSATDGVLYQPTLGTGSPNKLLNSLHRWVWIDGPTAISSVNATSATWVAQPLGGNGTWTYQWLASQDGGPWTQVSTSSSYTRTIPRFAEYELQLKIVGTSLGEAAPELPPAVITVSCGGC